MSENEATPTWFVYLLRCADDSLYTGITTDLQRRVHEHNHCNKKGARYTRPRRPVSLVYQETQVDRAAASQREVQLKKLTRKQKLALLK
ncbi:GIY-YIG nuclease family protein [Corallincola luteus]|uniref:GIY-YIG nuclease family protein n=1 Tax=Corallincola luteus TaxID=1775177 RepID=A0ABY2AHX4_9GAMM|nr:GIY-YIG nuclease family protein [Corallincola luteus]TCI01456.1 GIY-YIG nuclease family protein [Corallincola luteus]